MQTIKTTLALLNQRKWLRSAAKEISLKSVSSDRPSWMTGLYVSPISPSLMEAATHVWPETILEHPAALEYLSWKVFISLSQVLETVPSRPELQTFVKKKYQLKHEIKNEIYDHFMFLPAWQTYKSSMVLSAVSNCSCSGVRHTTIICSCVQEIYCHKRAAFAFSDLGF